MKLGIKFYLLMSLSFEKYFLEFEWEIGFRCNFCSQLFIS